MAAARASPSSSVVFGIVSLALAMIFLRGFGGGVGGGKWKVEGDMVRGVASSITLKCKNANTNKMKSYLAASVDGTPTIGQ